MRATADQVCNTFEEASAVSVETLPEGFSSDSRDGSAVFPTIELSSFEDFPVETIEIQPQDELPTTTTAIAVAELVADSVRDRALEEGRSRSSSHSHFPTRAEFVSATFIKETCETPLGISLSNDSTISFIASGSMASASPLKAGDKIFSVNKRRCQYMSGKAICTLLKSLSGGVTVVAHNKGGTASIVESMVAKPHPNERSGLVLKRVGDSELLVSNIRPDKVFINSLLNIGDEVLKINGISCKHLSPIEAADIIKQTPKDVTVIAKSLLGFGVVVAELSTRDLMSRFSSSPVCRQQHLNRRRKQSTPQGRRITAQRATCLIIVLVAFFVTIALVVTSKRSEKDGFLYELGEDDLFPVDHFSGDYPVDAPTNATDVTTNATTSTGTLIVVGCEFWGFDCD